MYLYHILNKLYTYLPTYLSTYSLLDLVVVQIYGPRWNLLDMAFVQFEGHQFDFCN